jgi:hypothetical protein
MKRPFLIFFFFPSILNAQPGSFKVVKPSPKDTSITNKFSYILGVNFYRHVTKFSDIYSNYSNPKIPLNTLLELDIYLPTPLFSSPFRVIDYYVKSGIAINSEYGMPIIGSAPIDFGFLYRIPTISIGLEGGQRFYLPNSAPDFKGVISFEWGLYFSKTIRIFPRWYPTSILIGYERIGNANMIQLQFNNRL